MTLFSPLLVVFTFGYGHLTELTTFRCDRETIRLGDTKYEVRAHCGQPYDITYQTRVVIENQGSNFERRKYLPVECWLFNLGSRRFTYMLEFERNRVVSIYQGSYGYDEEDPDRCAVIGGDLDQGDYQSVVLMKCGDPSFRDSYEEEQIIRKRGSEYVEVIRYDEWTYNFGPRYFMSILVFRNGVLVDTRKGDYGF